MKILLKGFLVLVALMPVVMVSIMQSNLVAPVRYSKPSEATAQKMTSLGFPKSLATSVVFAAQRTNLEPDFVVALIFSESNFNVKAISSKGYYGLTQIPHRITDPDANILIGCQIFNEKLTMAKGDVVHAIVLYKGYGNDYTKGKIQAEKVLSLYHRLRKMEVPNEQL